MKKDEIIKLGTTLGLKFNEKTCYPYDLERDFVVFDGVNCQRFSIDGQKLSDDEILEDMGYALKLMGRRKLKLELHTLLNVMSDNTARIQECHILIGHIICEMIDLEYLS